MSEEQQNKHVEKPAKPAEPAQVESAQTSARPEAAEPERSKAADATHPKGTFFGHPLGLLNIFATEMCERFSYYGMRAILVYFLYDTVGNGGLGLESTDAMVIMSIFGSLVYLSGIVGGWVTDRMLGPYRSVLYGGIVIAVGHIVLGLPFGTTGVFSALALIVAGTGLLKPNVSVMVGELYSQGDARRQAGFSLLVMAINLGSAFSPLIVGTVSSLAGYHVAFLIPSVTMAGGIFIYIVLSKRTLAGIGRLPAEPFTRTEKKRWIGIAAVVVVASSALFGVLAAWGLLSLEVIVDSVPVVCLLITGGLFVYMIRDKRVKKSERSRVFAYIPVIAVAACFWGISEQQASTLAILANDAVNNDFFGFVIPEAWYQSVNPLVIIILSPLFAYLWTKLGKRQPGFVAKMTIGLLLTGTGFAIMGSAFLVNSESGLLSPLWLLGPLVIMTVGELFLSPTGLNVTTLLAPRIHSSKMMALWFVSDALGQGINAFALRFFDESAPAGFFLAYAGVAVLIAGVFFLLRKPILTASEK